MLSANRICSRTVRSSVSQDLFECVQSAGSGTSGKRVALSTSLYFSTRNQKISRRFLFNVNAWDGQKSCSAWQPGHQIGMTQKGRATDNWHPPLKAVKGLQGIIQCFSDYIYELSTTWVRLHVNNHSYLFKCIHVHSQLFKITQIDSSSFRTQGS